MARLSIGMPIYNGAEFLRDAIESILNQTFQDFELIISDNASTDDTMSICQDYAAQDPRIRYFRQETNIGAGPNFNFVFDQATAEYFKWAAHDDVLLPRHLETCVGFLDDNPAFLCAHTNVKIFDRNMVYKQDYELQFATHLDDVARRLKSQIRGHQCYEIFGVFRRDILLRTPSMGSYFAADAVLLVRLVLQGRFWQSPEYLFHSRQHEMQSEQFRRKLQLYLEWFDPSNRGQISFPYWRVLKEYFRSVNMFPLSFRDRMRCRLIILTWMRQRVRYLSGDAIRATALVGSRTVSNLRNGFSPKPSSMRKSTSR